MKKPIIQINIRNFIVGAAASAILICLGPLPTQAQATTCLTAQAIMAQKDTITQAEVVKQRDCWVDKLKKKTKNMVGAFLVGAELPEPLTDEGWWFRNIDFTNANLTNADLSGVDMYGLNFTGAVMISTRLGGADLRTATFKGTDLRLASLRYAKVFGANFTNADLRGADLEDCGFATYDERFAEMRSEISEEEWKRIPGDEITRMKKGSEIYQEKGQSVTLTGAKINSIPVQMPGFPQKTPATKGTSADYWKSRGGVVVN